MNPKFTHASIRALVMVILLGAGVLQAQIQELAYVANVASDDVTVIDLSTNTVLTTISISTLDTTEFPRDIAISPDSTVLAVTNPGPGTINGNEVPGNIILIDVFTNTVIDTIVTFKDPNSALYDPTGNFIYQSTLPGNRVVKFDLATETPVDTLDFPGAGPTGLALRPTTDSIYVVLSSLGELGSFNLTNDQISPFQLLLEGASGGSSTNPFNIAITSDGSTGVVPNSSSTATSIIDFTTGSVSRVKEELLPGLLFDASMSSPIGVAITPDDSFALVTEETAGELSIISLTSGNNEIVNTVSFGASTQPLGVAVSPDGAKAVVSLFGTDEVAIVDLATLAFTTVSVGSNPRAVKVIGVDPCDNIGLTQVADTICDSDFPYAFGTQSLTSAGVFRDTIQTTAGCDSIVELTLSVNSTFLTPIADQVCDDALPYTFFGQSINTSGVYTEILTAANGCDSTIELTLTVNPTFDVTDSVFICQGQTFQFGTQTLTRLASI